MPKKIDPKVKERCVRMVLDHLQEYPTVTAAAEAVAKREGVGKESVRRWVIQAQIDGGQRQGPTSEELAEIKELKAKVRRLEKTTRSSVGLPFSPRGNSTPATADRRVRGRDARRGPRGRVDLPSAARAGLPGHRAGIPILVPARPAAGAPGRQRRLGAGQGAGTGLDGR